MMASCGSDDYTEKVNSVQVESAETTIAATGGTAIIKVTGTGLSVSSAASWLTASVSGNTITATASQNTMRESRATHITVTAANGDQQLISVIQFGQILALGTYEVEVNGSTHTIEVSAESNVDFTVSSNVDWITATYDEETGIITIDVKANVDENTREGAVTVTSNGLTETITISQGGIVLNVSDPEWYIKTSDAATLTIPVERSIEVTASTSDDWLTATFNEETSELAVTTPKYSAVLRAGVVTLRSGSRTVVIPIDEYGS